MRKLHYCDCVAEHLSCVPAPDSLSRRRKIVNSNHELGQVIEELHRELISGEQLVWSGRPRGGIRFRPSDALMIPFSLIWGGFAFFWEFSVTHSKAPSFLAIWGIPFVLVGIYIIVGRFFVDAAVRARTSYGLTNRRAVIISCLFSRQVRSVDLRSIPELTFRESTDGSGTITFGTAEPWVSSRRGGVRSIVPQFEFIEDARSVYEKARDIHLKDKNSA